MGTYICQNLLRLYTSCIQFIVCQLFPIKFCFIRWEWASTGSSPTLGGTHLLDRIKALDILLELCIRLKVF
jgi:hypothetical protein